MRKVKVYSTATGLKVIESSATTWGELQADLDNNNVSYSGMNVVENVNNSNLTLDEAKLPESDFVLMLTPKKTKSGADLPYKEVRAKIQQIIAEYGDEAKAHFNVGKNYTMKSTADLNALYNSWTGGSTPVVETKKSVAAPVKSAKVSVSKKHTLAELCELILETPEAQENIEFFTETVESLLNPPVKELNEEEELWIESMKNRL